MADEAKKVEEKVDVTPASTKIIKDASPDDVAEAEANQKKAEGEGDKKPEGDVQPPVVEIDYKAELESVTKRLDQAEFLLKEKNIADKKKRDAEATPPNSDDAPADDSKPTDDVDKKLEDFKLDQLKDVIQTELASMSDNADERGLIEFYFKNVIKRSGDTKEAIKADLDNARFLANKKRFEKIDEEIKAKKKSDDAKASGGGSGGEQIDGDAPKNTPTVTDADAQLLKRYGLKPEDIKS